MKYYSTNKQAPVANLEEAVVKGLAIRDYICPSISTPWTRR